MVDGTSLPPLSGSKRFQPTPVYELLASTSEEPIETHRKFEEIAGTEAAPLNGAKFDENGLFIGFGRTTDGTNEFMGVDSFLAVGWIYRMSYFTTDTKNISGYVVGRIVSKPSGAPDIGPDRSWLLIRSDRIRKGHLYQIVHEFRMSGEKGWNKTLYS
jgi:hypothetical protein